MKRTTSDSSFYATQSVGKTRRLTPEGFLLCEGVPIARAGVQLYTAAELDLPGDPSRVIHIDRPAEEVFRPESIASVNGKAFTLDHPGEPVTPENWARIAKGTAQNARRGDGAQNDLLLADLLITDAYAIKYVNDNLPQISSGYEAEYEMFDDSRGTQRNIVINHVAGLKRGRAGSRCAITDGDTSMTNKPWLTRFLNTLGVKDPEAAAEVIASAGNSGPQVTNDTAASSPSVQALQKDVGELKTGLAEIKTLLTNDAAARKAKEDEAAKAATLVFSDTEAKTAISRAEILSPGIALPAIEKIRTEDGMKDFVIGAIERAAANEQSRPNVEPLLAGREAKKLTLDAAMGVFAGAAEVARVKNTTTTASAAAAFSAQASTTFPARASVATKDGKPVTMADVITHQQKTYDDFWSKQKAS